jgi:hypothetical protein
VQLKMVWHLGEDGSQSGDEGGQVWASLNAPVDGEGVLELLETLGGLAVTGVGDPSCTAGQCGSRGV